MDRLSQHIAMYFGLLRKSSIFLWLLVWGGDLVFGHSLNLKSECVQAHSYALLPYLYFVDNEEIAQTIDTTPGGQLLRDTTKFAWNPLDSIRIYLREKPFITGALDGRNSFVSADLVSVFGLRYGYDWGKVAAHTGIYGSRYIEFTGNDSMLYRFRYISSTFEYKLYRTYRYSFLCFGQVGIGATSVKSKLDPVGSPDLKAMIPLELGMYGSVRLLRYFGLAAGLGTRLAVLKGGNRFSGPIYTFGITYFPSAMLEDGKKVMDKLNIKIPTTEP